LQESFWFLVFGFWLKAKNQKPETNPQKDWHEKARRFRLGFW
jgi:hypothetical protein